MLFLTNHTHCTEIYANAVLHLPTVTGTGSGYLQFIKNTFRKKKFVAKNHFRRSLLTEQPVQQQFLKNYIYLSTVNILHCCFSEEEIHKIVLCHRSHKVRS